MNHEDARIAGTNRLPPLIVYDVAIPPPPTSASAPLLCCSLSFPLTPSVDGEFMIYSRQWRGHGHQEQQGILLLLICQMHHLLYSTLTGSDIPALT